MWSELLKMAVAKLAELVSGRIVQDLSAAFLPPPHADKWLRTPAARASMQQATLEALRVVGERSSGRDVPFFDEHFLQREDVAALLARLLLPGGPTEAETAHTLAALWRNYLPGANTQRVPVDEHADAFISAYTNHLRGYAPFRVLLQSQDTASALRLLAELKPADLPPVVEIDLSPVLERLDALLILLQSAATPQPSPTEQTPLLWKIQPPGLPDPIAEQGVLSQIPLLYTNSEGRWLVTAARNGQIFAYTVDDERPNLRWRVQLPNGYGGPEALVRWRNQLLVAPQPLQAMDGDKDLLLLDEHTGDTVRRIPLPVRQFSPPAVDGDTAYTVGSDGALYAVDLQTGQVERLLDRLGSCSPFPSAIDQGRLLAGAAAATLSCVDLVQRRINWQQPAPAGVDGTPGYFMAAPVVEEGIVYAANWNGSLYAIALDSGKELWRYATAGFLPATPTLAEDLVLVVSKDHRLHAVDRRSGKQRWVSADMGRRLYSRPLVVGSGNTATVYVAPFRSQLYALRLSDGQPTWAQPLDLPDRVRGDLVAANGQIFVTTRRGHIAAVQVAAAAPLHSVDEWLDLGQWPQAVLQLLRQGDTLHAAALFYDHHFYYRAGKLYEEVGDLSAAAAAFARDGVDDSWRRAAVLYRQVGDLAAAARQLERLSEWADAAQAWRAAGEIEKAAEVYHKQLGEIHTAAQLYVGAGKPSLAATLYEECGDFDAAIEVLRQAGEATYRPRIRKLRTKAARVARGDERRRLLSALIAETSDALEQAEIYADAGEWTLSAEKWVEAGQWRRAAELLVAQDAMDRAIELLQSRAEREAQSWAAVLLTSQQRWREAVVVYQQLDDPAGQAACHTALGNWAQAADCYEQAGYRAEVPKADDETREFLAELFRQAAHAYAQNFEGRSARRIHCLQKARYYRKHPWLTISFAPEQANSRFVVNDANVLLLTVTNLGAGLARNVRVDLIDVEQPPRIRLHGQETVAGIPGQRSHVQKVNLYASIGGGLLVDVHLSWTDPDGAHKSVKLDRWTIPVVDPSKRDGSTPTALHVEGNVYYTSGGDVIHGNQYRDQAQHRDGDTVEINRNRAASTPASAPPVGVVCPHCGAHNPTVAAFCDGCGQQLSAAMP